MEYQFHIVGLGEALFDIFSNRQVLAGAPLNTAVHAHQLASAHGGCGVVVSRVGQDELGARVRNEIAGFGMSIDYLQDDPDHPTGKVHVTVDDDGQPDYEIVEGVAWDWLQWDPETVEIAHRCDVVCFTSLAQRVGQSRNTIWRFLTEARGAEKIFDLTLRQHYYNQNILRRSCELATIVKLNLDELDVLAIEINLHGDSVDDKAKALLCRYDLRLVVLPRGKDGTVIYTPSHRFEGVPASCKPVEGADAVGAGDACTASIAVGLALQMPLQKIADLANQAGAFVASVPGSTPTLPESILGIVK